jgi:Ice-binding-like
MANNFIGQLFNISDVGGLGRVATFIEANAVATGSPAVAPYGYVVATPTWVINENSFQLVILSHADVKEQYGHGVGSTVAETLAEVTMDGGAALIAAMNANYAGVGGTPSPVTSQLGSAAAYTILAYSGVTNSDGASTVISGGDIGSFPTNSITPGTPAWTLTNGASVVTATATNQTDLAIAIVYFQGLVATPIAASFTTTTFTATATGYAGGPGFVGFASSTLHFTGGTITLDGAGLTNPVFVFQVGSALNVDTAATTINLINGATAANVVWVVGSTATFDAHNHVWAGDILAHTSITTNSISLMTMSGRLLANTGAVTISNPLALTIPAGSGTSLNYVQTVDKAQGFENQAMCTAIQSN